MSQNFTCEVDQIDATAWYALLDEFADANFYQTHAYGAVRWGEGSMSHLVLKSGETIIGAAQARIMRLPLGLGGIAYIRWGGFWQRKDAAPDLNHFRAVLDALVDEYVKKRGLFLRLLPNIFDHEAGAELEVLKAAGFTRRPPAEGGRTVLIDLSHSLEDLRAAMQGRWRNYLKRAEKAKMDVIEESSVSAYGQFIELYREMHRRKGFVEYVDVDEYAEIQKALPDDFKMRVLRCSLEGVEQGSIVCAHAGNIGIYVLGATSDAGLKSRSTYLMHWQMMCWLKENGYRWYDLGGIDPDKVPGTAQFKYGMSGKLGLDVYQLGQFDCCRNPISYLAIRGVDGIRALKRQWQEWRAG